MLDYCAGDIHTEQADMIIRDIQKTFGGGELIFIPDRIPPLYGMARRKTALGTVTPPHDITGRVIGDYLPLHPDAAPCLT